MHLAPGAALGKSLEEGAARIHHRDHRRRKGLAEDERRGHGQRGNDIEADLAAPDAAQDLDHERGERRNDPGDPDKVREIGFARDVERKSASQTGDGRQQNGGLEAVGTVLFRAPHLPRAEAIAAGSSEKSRPTPTPLAFPSSSRRRNRASSPCFLASAAPLSRPSTISAVAQASASAQVAGDDGDRGRRCDQRRAASRIHGVREASSLHLDPVAVVARRRHGGILQPRGSHAASGAPGQALPPRWSMLLRPAEGRSRASRRRSRQGRLRSLGRAASRPAGPRHSPWRCRSDPARWALSCEGGRR